GRRRPPAAPRRSPAGRARRARPRGPAGAPGVSTARAARRCRAGSCGRRRWSAKPLLGSPYEGACEGASETGSLPCEYTGGGDRSFPRTPHPCGQRRPRPQRASEPDREPGPGLAGAALAAYPLVELDPVTLLGGLSTLTPAHAPDLAEEAVSVPLLRGFPTFATSFDSAQIAR